MKVEVTVRIDEQKVATIQEEIPTGSALELEEQTRKVMQRAGGAVLDVGLNRIARDVRPPTCCARRMENRGMEGLTLQTTLGEVHVARPQYRCPACGLTFHPADVELCCGVHRITRALAQRACQLATVEHFTRLEQLLADQHGVHVSREELVELVHDVGSVAERLRLADAQRNPETGQRLSEPPAEVHPPRVYVSCDGITYCTNRSEPDPHHPGRKRLIWQQMKVGCVYWQTESGQWRKQMIWGRESPEEFGAALYRLACRCGYKDASEKIFAADGADWCWDIQARYFSAAVGILDWYHGLEHVWAAAKVLFAEDEGIQSWVAQARQILWEKGGAALTTWLDQQSAAFRRSPKKHRALQDLVKYVANREWLMNCPAYRAKDFQIGTGMIESTVRQLVGLRLKGPGMHWTERGALAVTALRAQDLNGHWHAFWKTLVIAG